MQRAQLFPVIAAVVLTHFHASAASGLPEPGRQDTSQCLIEARPDVSEVWITHAGVRLLTWTHKASQFKPYVSELRALNGVNILRDAPPDHLHHHGLMYAIRINGSNFWEEAGDAGVQRALPVDNVRSGRNAAGSPEAGFTQLIHWIAFAHRTAANTLPVALLVEERTLTLTVNKSSQEVALRWDSKFKVGPGASQVRLHGSVYNGLGLRLPSSFDQVAHHRNSQSAPYPAGGRGDVVAARWSSVTGMVEQNTVTAVLFGHSKNPGGMASFYTMTTPFTYLSVTQALDKNQFDYKQGDEFSLRYLLLICVGDPKSGAMNRRADIWEAL